MVLTERERKILSRLQRQHRVWPRIRWFCLVAGMVFFVYSSFGVTEEAERLMFSIIGSYLLAYAWLNWPGEPAVALLLKVVEDRLDEGQGTE